MVVRCGLRPPFVSVTTLGSRASPRNPWRRVHFQQAVVDFAKIDLVLPMTVQQIKASPKVAADAGLVALQYGPLIYNIESVDQSNGLVLNPAAPWSVQYTNILGGFMKITGIWTNGAALTAIPNYSRLNRGGSSAVWFRDQ